MKSNKGQALVEFIIILPITLLLIFTVVDFGRIISLKSNLENVASDAVSFYENGKTEEEINRLININREDNVKVIISIRDEYTNIVVKRAIIPITPGLTYISKDIFDVSVSRVIYNE